MIMYTFMEEYDFNGKRSFHSTHMKDQATPEHIKPYRKSFLMLMLTQKALHWKAKSQEAMMENSKPLIGLKV